MKFSEAEIVARRFLNKHNLYVPLNLKIVAEILNIEIKQTTFNGEGAMLYNRGRGKRSLVAVDMNQRKPIRRFNIAHELAHCLLGHEGFFLRCTPTESKSLQEKCTDICASELLIPTPVLKQEAFKNNHDVKILKRIFGVSEKAIVTKMRIKKMPYFNTFYE